ncbi:MAG: tetratricopeptide repeat protein, partial [Spirochaetia bacterium]
MITGQVQELLVRARNAFRIQDYEAADKQVRQMLDEYPDSVTATILMGIIAGRTGQPAEAIKLFKRALKLDPKSAEAYNNLAVILRQQARLKQALAAVRHAEKLDPGRPDILYNRGNILKDLGHIDRAIAAYLQALKIDARFVLAHNNLGTLYQANGDVNHA